MVSTPRRLAAGFAAGIALLGLAGTPLLATAAPLSPAAPVAPAFTAGPVPPLTNASQSRAAADYLASQLVDGNHLVSPYTGQPDVGITADALLAIAASQTHQAEAQRITTWLEVNAAAYAAKGPGNAGKLAIVARTMRQSPDKFGGVNLTTTITNDLSVDPTAGGNSFALALALLGLGRATGNVPDTAVAALIAQQDASGAFGYTAGGAFTADPDTTGVVLQALLASKGSTEAQAAAAKALRWVNGQTTGGLYWATYSPANTSGLLIPALAAAGEPTASKVTWLLGQQISRSGFPAALNGTEADAYATAQAMFGITGASYVTVLFVPAASPPPASSPASAPATTPTGSSSSTASRPAATATTTWLPASSVSTSPGAGTGLPQTGDAAPGIVVVGGIVLAGLAVARRRRR